MTPAELRAELRARKKELRKSVASMRKEARAKVDAVPAVQREKRRRQIRRVIGLTIIALLLLFIRCDCGAGAPLPIAKAVVPPPAVVKPKPKVSVKVAPKKALGGDGTKTNRNDMGLGAPAAPTWIDEFQLQVAARSPRLAQCFTGIDRPGALRWSASVNPQSGGTADHELEPVGFSTELSPEQRECVVKVLSSPVYKLTAPQKEALPNRISLVIEF